MMVALFLTTTISCKSAAGLLQKISKNIMLTEQQKVEIAVEIRHITPSCPIKIDK
jgi:hypothetical protein